MSNDLVDKITKEILDTHPIKEEKSVKVKKENAIKEATDFIKSKSKKVSFPTDAFPEIIQKILIDWNTSTNLPVEYFATAVLVAGATAIGNKIQLKITPTWYEAPVLYAVIVGPNGIGKSPVWNYALAPLHEISNEYQSNHQSAMKNYHFNIAQLQSNKQATTLPDPPVERDIMVQTATMETLIEILHYNPKGLLLFRDELKGWMMSMNQYRAGDDLQKWLEMWNNKKVDKKTKLLKLLILRAFVNILGGIQPKVLASLATANNVANGLFQRFLFAYPYAFKRSKWSNKHPSEKLLETYNDIIKWIHNLQDRIEAPAGKWDEPVFTSMKIIFSEDAELIRQEYFNWCSQKYNELVTEDENAAGVYSKFDVYASRFALILRVFRYADEESDQRSAMIEPEITEGIQVEAEDINNAIKLCKYYIRQSLRILESMESPVMKLKDEYQYWYKALPDTFSRSQAVQLVEDLKPKYQKEFNRDLSISPRTMTRLLNGTKTDQPIFQKNGQGYYRKLFEV